jgi:hypothetical protein
VANEEYYRGRPSGEEIGGVTPDPETLRNALESARSTYIDCDYAVSQIPRFY